MPLFKRNGRILLIVIMILILAIGALYKVVVVNRADFLKHKPIELKIKVANREKFGVNIINERDILKEYDTGTVVGEIRRVEAIPATRNVTSIDGEIRIAEIPDRFDLFIEIEGEAIFTDNSIVSGDRELRIGSNIVLKTKSYALDGIILELNSKEE